jgi:hypothetical protein
MAALDELKAIIQINNPLENKRIIREYTDKDLTKVIWTHGESILHWACAFNNTDIIKFVLDNHKVHVNMSNYRGTTPLYYAASKDHYGAIKLMLSYGANPCIRSGFTGLMTYETTGDPECRLLLEYWRDSNVPIGYDSKNHLKLLPRFSVRQSYKYRNYMFARMKLDDLLKSREDIAETSKECDTLLKSWMVSITDKSVRLCLNCDSPGAIVCPDCEEAWFCSTGCQRICQELHHFDCN